MPRAHPSSTVATSALFALLAALPLAFAAPALSEARPDERHAPTRGTIVSRDQDEITIKPESGASIVVRLEIKSKILMAQRATVRDIKPESYLSVIATPAGDTARATAVTIHSPSERGLFAGRRPADEAAGTSFTSGWVDTITDDDPRRVGLQTTRSGRTDHQVDIAAGTPTTQIVPGEKALLVEGAAVTMFTHPESSGPPVVDLIAVGRPGVKPTL